MSDPVHHPPHYTSHPACCECGRGVECIQIAEHMGFCLGNAVKYLWRCQYKHSNPVFDLRKAIWYIEREIQRIEEIKNVERIPQRHEIRSQHQGASQDEGQAASKAINHPHGVSPDCLFSAGEEARGPLCASDGDGDICGVVPEGFGGVPLEREQFGQSVGEPEIRKQERQPRKEGPASDRLQWGEESSREADKTESQRNQGIDRNGNHTCENLRRVTGCNRPSEAWGQLAADLILRADLKGDAIQDLEKARWYIDREIALRKMKARLGE